ncbi:hypothetical protein DSM03_1184 [Leeuwenhoekiella aestuarii]|nr:hypothetical protein DSM03_1184 [Leeuwenhoekiella aestuarii]
MQNYAFELNKLSFNRFIYMFLQVNSIDTKCFNTKLAVSVEVLIREL